MSYSHMTLLPDRGIVAVQGPDAADFLQNLVTNDLETLKPGQAIFAGLLTPQGKIAFDFLIYMRAPQNYWLDCARDQAESLAKRLTLYKLRARVEIADRSGEFSVGAAWGGEPVAGDSTFLATYADPRHAPLGVRFVAQNGGAGAQGLAAMSGTETPYHSHRVALAVPQGGLDYAFGEAFPHEACYDDLNGVDFGKGCYVGQEVVSRMHHRGIAKTRIAAIEASEPIASTGAEIRAGEYPVGTLGSMDGARGIAMLRLDRLQEGLRHGIPLRVGDVTLIARAPAWASYQVPSGRAES